MESDQDLRFATGSPSCSPKLSESEDRNVPYSTTHESVGHVRSPRYNTEGEAMHQNLGFPQNAGSPRSSPTEQEPVYQNVGFLQHVPSPRSRLRTGPAFKPDRSPILRTRALDGNTKQIVLGALSFTCKTGVLLFSRMFLDRVWRALQIASLCRLFLNFFGSKLHPAAEAAFQPWSAPVATLTLARPLVHWTLPDFFRTARFWKRLIPIYTRYMITKVNARKRSREERHKLWAIRHEWGGERVHQLVLDMSGFYVKSAQILASKADFVPEAWRKWLSKHLDDAPPRPFAGIKKIIEKELGICHGKSGILPLDTVFSNVEHEAIAAASIAQVHGATLIDGTAVVIKVQHLGMDKTMHSDLRNLARVARFLKGQLPVDLTPIVKEIQETIPLEFNFEREVWFMTHIRNNLSLHGFTSIVCPSPVTNLCTPRMIVMERICGIPFTHILHRNAKESFNSRLPEVRNVVKHLIHAYGQMFLADGVFHADPHAGNLLLLSDGRLGLVDFGQSKVLSQGARDQFARMVVSLADGDDKETARTLYEMGIEFGTEQGEHVPVPVLAMMARMLFDTCYVEEATVSPMAENSILRKVPMKSFNQELWLVVRTILILRGLLFSLEMDVSAVQLWKPYALSCR